MYIDLQPIFDKCNIHPKGVIAVGAHYAEEHEDYVKWGIKKFIYVEPCRSSFNEMARRLLNGDDVAGWVDNNDVCGIRCKDINLVMAACGSESKASVPMYVSHQNQGQSNSLLRPELHLLQHPDILFNDAETVRVVPLDDLAIEKKDYDLLVLDVQGYEGEVFKGALETLKYINIIYTEVNRGQTYALNMEIDELDELLFDEGFLRIETFWPSPSLSWGDAVFIRESLINFKK